jgi:hypothetical protein
MTVVRLKPKQTTVREGLAVDRAAARGMAGMGARRVRQIDRHTLRVKAGRFGYRIAYANDWLVRDLDSTDVIPYTEDELWKEFER